MQVYSESKARAIANQFISFYNIWKINVILVYQLSVYMMSEQQQVFNIWEKSSFSKPLHRDTFKGMHLAALQHLAEKSSDKELYVIRYADHDFVLLEVKGTLSKDMHIDLGATGVGGMWLCLQFQGQTIFSAYERLSPERMAAVKTSAEGTDIPVSRPKRTGDFFSVFLRRYSRS